MVVLQSGRSRKRRAAGAVLGAFLVLLGALVVGGLIIVNHVSSAITIIADPFAGIPARPPGPAVTDADGGEARAPVNILLLGSDSRRSGGDPGDWTWGGQRTDTMMLLHIPGDRQSAYVMSFPRDSWVDIPGHGRAKLNAAYSYGGVPLLIQTMEARTGVRIDHVAIVDFESFSDVTDAVGGVEITVPKDSYAYGKRTFAAGTYTMTGSEALAYARQRYGLSGGDFDRIQRQQNWIRSVAKKALGDEVLTSPRAVTSLVTSLSRSVAVDPGFDVRTMVSLALSMRNMDASRLTFLTVPVDGVGWSPDGKQSIVRLDDEGLDSLMQAVVDDDVASYVADNKKELNLLGTTVR